MSAPTTPAVTLPSPVPNHRTGKIRLLLHDMRFGLITAGRTPFPLLIALFFPLFFNVMFNLLQSGETVGGTAAVQSTTAAIIVFIITAAGYFNMATGIVIAREKGVLKRVRQTPMPKVLHMGSRIGGSVLLSGASIVIMLAVSLLAFGLELRPAALPSLVIVFLLGSVASCAMGLAVTRLIPSVEAALMVSTATLFPLLFVSGVFFPLPLPGPVQTVVDLLPFAPMVEATRTALDPAATGLALDLPSLAIIAVWGAAAILAALKTMPWEPQN
ncbi:ABC transporter permease [Nocardiopsis sp. NPDC006832]|uniref:ABC transporter permease n=1 Tax=Nocardiopsis sp. NPDC006832 TaxID=3157188 RepID=UPI0033D65E6A